MIFELKKGNLRATAQTRGGELASLRDGGGREYIWEGDPAFWPGQNPILFPIVGSLLNGKIQINGTTYEMGRHGFARGMEFAPVEQGEDFVALELRETEETLACYPFPFSLRVTHRLLEDGFSTTFSVQNTGGSPMPFCIGGHTAIRIPEGERFEDFHLLFDQAETADSHLLSPQGIILHDGRKTMLDGTGTLALDYQDFAQMDTLIFSMLRSGNVSLVHRETGRGVRLDFHEFPMVAFWTKPGAPFLCMEPWLGCAAWDNESGRFEDKLFCAILQPGEVKELAYTFYLE
ncbi:MAG: aldose 1-epimerase family protein [Lawsonibacter sp.]|jgi:galactose mutarotase-like enzyme|nr:aldose 1-epimerase family protein [Lawsonibacter sp.]